MEPIRGTILALGIFGAAVLAPQMLSAADEAAETSVSEQPIMADEKSSVERLLDKLAQAKSESEAKALERKVFGAWHKSGSDTVDLLTVRANTAIKQKRYGISLAYLDTIIELRPDFAEGWNMRATVYYLIDEYELSLADIQHVLVLQPRHFGALNGLGMILRKINEPAEALKAFRGVLSVHPYFGNTQKSVDKLIKEVEGRKI